MNTVTTKKGTQLPLLNLKGKDYLQVAHRLVWFVEEQPNYVIENELILCNDEQTVAKVTVTIFNDKKEIVRKVSDIKRETKKDFPDHTEKALTGALGRCMASLGYGTAYALADLDEGNRIVDAAQTRPAPTAPAPTMAAAPTPPAAAAPKSTGFRRPGAAAPASPTTDAGSL